MEVGEEADQAELDDVRVELQTLPGRGRRHWLSIVGATKHALSRSGLPRSECTGRGSIRSERLRQAHLRHASQRFRLDSCGQMTEEGVRADSRAIDNAVPAPKEPTVICVDLETGS